MGKKYIFSWYPWKFGEYSNLLSPALSSVTLYHIIWDWGMSGDSQADTSMKASEISEASFSLFTPNRKVPVTLD